MGNPSTDSGASSGIQVLDRAVSLMLGVARQPQTLNELAEHTGIPRATVHRLASALETHQLLTRTENGRWTLGDTFSRLATSAPDRLITAATPIMRQLVLETGESVQLYKQSGTSRTCIAAQEPSMGLQNTVPVGTQLPLTAGSAAKVFLAYSPATSASSLKAMGAKFGMDEVTLARTQGWAESVSEREVGLASISAPITDAHGHCLAVLSISGPSERLRPIPSDRWSETLIMAARALEAQL